MPPKVSIIIPVYNADMFLRKCLSSVTGQTLQEIEIICVNDGSTDNSQAILEEYAAKDPRVIIISQQNKGVSIARNVGLQVAQSEFIGFVDSDDWIEPETYETAIKFMVEDVDLVCWGINVVCENNTALKNKHKNQYNLTKSGKFKAEEIIGSFSLINVWNKLYRKALIKKHGILFPEGLLFEDNVFYCEYMPYARYVYYTTQKLYNHVVGREDSIMETTRKKALLSSHEMDHILGARYLYCFYKKNGLLKSYETLMANYFYKMFTQNLKAINIDKYDALFAKAAELANKMQLSGGKYGKQIFLLRSGNYNGLKHKLAKRYNPTFMRRFLKSFGKSARHIKYFFVKTA